MRSLLMRAARICGLEAGGKRRLYPASQKVGERKINFAIGAEERWCMARCLLIISDWHG